MALLPFTAFSVKLRKQLSSFAYASLQEGGFFPLAIRNIVPSCVAFKSLASGGVWNLFAISSQPMKEFQ